MKICIAGRSTRKAWAEPLAECLKKDPEHEVCLALIGPEFSVDKFLVAVEDAEILIVLLEGPSREPWFMALEAFGSGKFVLCLAPDGLTLVEEALLSVMSKNIAIIPRSDPEQVAHEVLPHFFERWGFRNPDQISLGVTAHS